MVLMCGRRNAAKRFLGSMSSRSASHRTLLQSVNGEWAGIGEAIATRFAHEGARVVTVDAIRKFAGEAVFVLTDVSSEPQAKPAVLFL